MILLAHVIYMLKELNGLPMCFVNSQQLAHIYGLICSRGCYDIISKYTLNCDGC